MYDIKESGKIRESKDTCAEDWIDVSVEIFTEISYAVSIFLCWSIIIFKYSVFTRVSAG